MTDKRKELKVYKTKTRIISWHCDAEYQGSGSIARDSIAKLFIELVKSLPKNEFLKIRVEFAKEIDIANKILAIDIKRDD